MEEKKETKRKAKTGRRVISASGSFEIEERNLAQWCVRDLKMKLKPMDDIMWNRWFSWQRQPIFGTWAVQDIHSEGMPSTFDPTAEKTLVCRLHSITYLERRKHHFCTETIERSFFRSFHP